MNGMSYRLILVPLDGSDVGERALPLAAMLSTRLDAQLMLLRIHIPPIEIGPVDPAWAHLPGGTLHADEALQEAECYLQSIQQRMDETWGVRPAIQVVDDQALHAPSEMICAVAQGAAADLIVMTTHGRGALGRAWLGSVAESCVRHSHIPVLLVRAAAGALTSPPALHRVLVPLDGSPLAETILDQVSGLCRQLGAEITLLHVVEPSIRSRITFTPEALTLNPEVAEQQEHALAYLNHLAEMLCGQGVQAQSQVVVAAHAANGILEYVAAHGISLIAMASHGRVGLRRMILGSVASKVLHEAAIPLLIACPHGEALAEQPAGHQALEQG